VTIPIAVIVANAHERFAQGGDLAAQSESDPKVVVLSIALLGIKATGFQDESALGDYTCRGDGNSENEQLLEEFPIRGYPLTKGVARTSGFVELVVIRVAPFSTGGGTHRPQLKLQLARHPNVV
jgi:hypothetical protein